MPTNEVLKTTTGTGFNFLNKKENNNNPVKLFHFPMLLLGRFKVYKLIAGFHIQKNYDRTIK